MRLDPCELMCMSKDRSSIAVGGRTMPDLAYGRLASDAAALMSSMIFVHHT
jgi:hypothetical protein